MLKKKNGYLYLFCGLLFTLSWCGLNYNLELIHHINAMVDDNSDSNFGVSDVWGYTDETGKEYAIVGYRYGTLIYDVSSSGEPVLISDIPGPSDGDYYFHRDYKTFGDYLYIVNEMTGLDIGMQIVDLSPLPYDIPIKLNTYTGVSQSHNLWVDTYSGYAFIEKNYPENIHIVDLANPGAPAHESSFSYWDGNSCHDIYTQTNYAYVSEGYNFQFGIYDINDILNPILLASIPSFGYAHNAWLNNAGTHLITGEETVGMTIKIWDVQNLNNINMVGQYLGENSLAHNVHVKNDFVYISHYTAGLKILDIFDPTKPVEVASYDTYPDDDDDGFYGCWGAYPFTENDFVYASDMQYGLYVFSFSNIRAGWLEGSISQNGLLLGGVILKAVINNQIFISDEDGNYEIGFPEGEYWFDFIINDVVINQQILTFYPHATIEYNIILNLIGDLNLDGVLNILDIVSLVNQILVNEYNVDSDLNSDGEVNILDIVQLINLILII